MLEFEELTPKIAGSSALALQISKEIIRQPTMKSLRDEFSEHNILWALCGHFAREVIDTLLVRERNCQPLE